MSPSLRSISHLTHWTDSPNTLTNLATSYVLLVPYNFNDHDPSIDSRNSVLLNKKKHGRYEVSESVNPKQCVPEPRSPLSYGGLEMWNERGEVVSPDEGSYGQSRLPPRFPNQTDLIDTSSYGMRLWH